MSEIPGCIDPYNGDPDKRFELIKKAGSGSFGVVELCRDRENGNKLVIRKLARYNDATTANEIAMLYHIRHKHIIKFYDYYKMNIDQATIDKYELRGLEKNTPMYALIIEYGEGGDFWSYIQERISIEETILVKIIDQVTQALQYLNQNRAMHRDIKPENMLFDKYGDIKLADFGTGDVLQEDATKRMFTQQTGTQLYMAPEIKAQQKYYTFLIDIYSLGMSIYRACKYTIPVNELLTIDVNGLPEPIPEQYSPQFSDLVQRMLAYNPCDRATIPNIRETLVDISTTKNLSESQQKLLESSFNLFYGIDGVFDKKRSFDNLGKILEETDNECPEAAFQLAQCYLYGDTVKKDEEQAITLLRFAARKLYSPALKLLAFCYQHGIGVEKDLFTTTQLLTIASEKDQEANFLLGYNIYNAPSSVDEKDIKCKSKEVINRDIELAFHYFLNAKNFVPAKNHLGLCYLKGEGVEQDVFESYKYFSSAANRGFLDAMYNLADFYLTQKSDNKKYTEKAIKLLTDAAKQYHMGAAFKLSELYKEGKLVPKDEKRSSLLAKINSNGLNAYDSMYSFALLKLKGQDEIAGIKGIDKNSYEAFARFTLCSEHHAGALYHLALCYKNGIGTEKDSQKAADLFEQASNRGIVDANCDLALCFLNGEGRTADKEKAIKLLTEASEHGSLHATYWLAHCYLNGDGVKEDKVRAVNLLRTAHAGGYTEATYLLADCLHKAEGINTEEFGYGTLEEARALFETAALKGHANASYELAMILIQGIEVYIDRQKSFKFFEIASKQNHPQATTELGKLYEAGYGTIQNYEKAFQLYQKATNLGDVKGIYHLAMCYLNGIGVQEDKEKARSLFEKSPIAESKYQLGTMYMEGIGGPKDETKGASLYEEAANLGNVDAKVHLGVCFLHGIGKPTDQIKAFNLYKEANKAKNTDGSYRLAKLYKKGIGTHQNPAEAFLLFNTLVAEKNHIKAMFELGNCYIEGFGTTEDDKTGIAFLKKAAENGSSKAMNLLGVCYLNGKGVKQNLDKAANYFKQATEAGNNLSKVNLAQCYIEGKGVPRNPEKGYQLLQETNEDPAAKFRIGVCLYKGAGVPSNKKEGLKLLSEAAFQKDSNALCYYGKLLMKGKDVKQDQEAAKGMFELAAKQGQPEAMYELALIYEKSDNEIEKMKADSFLQQSSDAGSPNASFYLGKKYFNDPQQKENGIKLIEKAANSNNIDALKEISRIYKEGDGVPVDLDKAEDYNQIAKQLSGDHVLTDMFASAFVPKKKKKNKLFGQKKKNGFPKVPKAKKT